MKKIPLTIITSLVLSTSAFAAQSTINQEAMETTTGGFQGPSAEDSLNTVQEIMDAGWLTDGNKVTIVGHIVKSMGHEVYMFKDATGEMPVEIDTDQWAGQTVTPNDKVKIYGEIEKGDSDVAVEAESIRIIK